MEKTSGSSGLRNVSRWAAGRSSMIVVACWMAVFAGHAFGAGIGGSSDGPTVQGGGAPGSLVLAQSVEHLDRLAREPMVVELRDGTLFVAGYGGRRDGEEKIPDLWRSRDHGSTWERVDVGRNADGAIGDSDVDLAVGADDVLYYVAMSYDRVKNEGTGMAVGVSRDAGATWKWNVLSRTRFDDRPWIGVAPDGTAHVIWNDGAGIRYWVSRDRGATWTERPRINDRGGSSHLAMGPHGEIAVRITPASASGNTFHPGVDLIAVSLDGGKTWSRRPAPGERDWSTGDEKGTPRWVEPIAWDEDGALYSLWGSARGIWLAQSANDGASWTQWHVVDLGEVSYFPYLAARGHGELAATWSSGDGDALKVHVATIHVGDGKAAPQVIEAPPFQADVWARDRPGVPMHRATAGEYVPVMFLRGGGLGVVTTIQNDPERSENLARDRAGLPRLPHDAKQPPGRSGFVWWKFLER